MRITRSLRISRDGRAPTAAAFSIIASGLLASAASAQWAAFINDTATRMPSTPLEAGITTTSDNQEKDYAWADLDNDGDTDLVCVRKVPFTVPGGKRGILFMNEGGVLHDRTATKANTALGEPASQGMLDQTNDRDVVIIDVNNDGWKDVVSATTISDGLPKYIGHPRIYMNMGESGGVWQGLRYEVARFPQLLSKAPNFIAWNPRFCSVAAGDLTGDGYADLFFGDYDAGSFDGGENPIHDMDHKLLINMGAANPGVFVDESTLRMDTPYTYDVGTFNYLYAAFGAASVIADMNGDGIKDVVKQTSLFAPIHVAVLTNRNPPVDPPGSEQQFTKYKEVYNGAAYFVSEGDLNNDGRLDLVMTDDAADRFLLNTGNAPDGQPNFQQEVFAFQNGQRDDGFGSQSAIVDLDNDGFRDVLISDIDVDDSVCCRRLHIYRNLGNTPTVTLREEWPLVIPASFLGSTHNVAPVDINGDGWLDLVIGRTTATNVWMNTGTKITATPPALVNPSTGTTLTVQITKSTAASIVAGSALLYLRVNSGAFSPISLTPLGGDQYSVTLPAGACGDQLSFYVSAQTTFGGSVGTCTLPVAGALGPFLAVRATGTNPPSIDEAFEGSTAGWTVVNDPGYVAGAWVAADPVATFSGGAFAAHEDDATPAPGVRAFITANGIPGQAAGNSDIDGGPTHLISPTIDATVGPNQIAYTYWFYSADTTTFSDTLTVSVSNNNGASWTTVKTYNASTVGWTRDAFNIGSFVTPTNQVKVRFTAMDGGTATTAEAGIDDFRLTRVLCAPPCPADTDGNSSVNVTDLLAVINGWGPCPAPCPPYCPADTDDNCQVNVTDLLAVINGWGPCP